MPELQGAQRVHLTDLLKAEDDARVCGRRVTRIDIPGEALCRVLASLVKVSKGICGRSTHAQTANWFRYVSCLRWLLARQSAT